MTLAHPLTRRALLHRDGLVFPADPAAEPVEPADARALQALDLELAALGFATTGRLRARLAGLSAWQHHDLAGWLLPALAEQIGAGPSHKPLFPHFPFEVPDDVPRRWQAAGLAPALPAADDAALAPRLGGGPGIGPRRVLDLGEDLAEAAAALVGGLCARVQPPSAQETTWLDEILGEQGHAALPWLPAGFPVRETAARALGALEVAGGPLPDALLAQHLVNPTEVLRFLAAGSGADPALQGETGWWHDPAGQVAYRTTYRFAVAKLPRARRRLLLGLLERHDADALHEAFARHRGYWVWVGQFLHPHEYASRFPRTAAAFAQVRRRAPDGMPAAPHRGRGARLEAALRAGDAATYVPLLADRPGQLGRRLDHALRATSDPQPVLAAFAAAARDVATPVLLAIWAAMPSRDRVASGRVYWPKGGMARAVVDQDRRATLPAPVAAEARAIAEAELLRRFAAAPPWPEAIVDLALGAVPAPFNARTAAPGALALPRGTRLALPAGDVLRLFLHWCEPPKGRTTDLDLSVGFYDAGWAHLGTCSYYELTWPAGDHPAAVSAGDRTSAPAPDGASEFVDLTLRRIRDAGARYAVMVVNAYSGLPFGKLDRAFAGLLPADDAAAAFDPRLVALRFGLAGEHGVYVPLALDLAANRLHWLDVAAHGKFAFNTADSSSQAITTAVPALLAYFASHVRPTMADVALLQAAARAEKVWLRGATTRVVARGGDDPRTFLARLQAGSGEPAALPAAPAFAALHTGDFPLAAATSAFVLLPGRAAGTLAAADLLTP